MRHPSEYTTVQMGAYRVMVVDAGTTIRDGATGREEIVDDTGVVFKGMLVYCTDLMLNRMKHAIAGLR